MCMCAYVCVCVCVSVMFFFLFNGKELLFFTWEFLKSGFFFVELFVLFVRFFVVDVFVVYMKC